MPLKAFSSFPSKTASCAAGLLLALCAAGAAARGLLPSPAGPAATAARGQSGPVYKPTLRVWVHVDSVRPALLQAAPGTVVVRAVNETESDVSLVVERVAEGPPAERVARVTVTPQDKDRRQEVVLTAGEYVYYEESRPDIQGRLVVGDGQ